MEKTLKNPKIKKVSVILTKEPLVEKKGEYKNSKKPVTLSNKKQICGHSSSSTKKKTAQLINKNNKECKVILERFNVNALKHGTENGKQKNMSIANNKGILLESLYTEDVTSIPKLDLENRVDGNIKSVKNVTFEKLPVYKQVVEVRSKENDDLYAFDEPDFENATATKKTKRNKKKVKLLKPLAKPRKKKHNPDKFKICNTYDEAVQDILMQVMKKVNNKSDNIKTIPNPPEIPQEPSSDDMIQAQDALPTVCNSDTEVNNTLQNEVQNSKNNNSKIVSAFCNPLRTNEKIRIISDITLDQSYDSDDSFLNEDLQPNANSTVLINEKCKPWRFDDHLRRNPHYLSIKKTALPCLQQDLVIDHIQLKKIEEHFAKISRKPKNRENKPSPTRESNLFCDTADKENVPHLNLIDTSNVVVDQHKLHENFSLNKQKRKVLGVRQQNVISNYTVRVPKNNEYVNNEHIKSKSKIQNWKNPELQNDEEVDENLDTPPQEILNESEDSPFALKLFEDEEPTMKFDENSKIYIPKVRKKKKKLHDNIDEVGQDKHKKEMTKKEQAELEKWAAKFNSLCEDIEKYKLEIE